VRTETEIGASAVSVSYAAVELARDIFGSLAGKRVLLAGAGKMAESAARHLRRAGVSEILVTNRTRARADLLAEEFQGQVVPYEDFLELLPEIDIVLASSGAPHFILTREQMRMVIGRRRNRPMFLIDIAVPRNIEPSVNLLDNVFLYDIDDLGRVVSSNLQARKNVAEQAEEIITEEVERMVLRLKTREVTPTIISLQEQLEQLRASEIERARGRLGSLTPQQEEAIDAITRGIINKIAHGPITEMRRKASDPDGIHLMNTIRKLFRLGEG
jgi:glutamyl-tRNA reductase